MTAQPKAQRRGHGRLARLRHPGPISHALLLASIALLTTSPAAETPAEKKDAAIPAALQPAIDKLVGHYAKKQKNFAEEIIEEAVSSLEEEFSLPDTTADALGQAGKAAAAEASALWKTQARQVMAKMYGGQNLDQDTTANLVASVETTIANPNLLPSNFNITPYVSPLNTDTWKDALKTHLDEKQLAELGSAEDWEKARQRRKFLPLAEASAERYRSSFSKNIEKISTDIQAAIELGPERTKKLEKTATNLVEEAIGSLAESQLNTILKASPSQQQQYLQSNYIPFNSSDITQPHESKTWTTFLKKFLTPSENKTYAQYTKDQKSRSIQTGADLLTLGLDDLLSLTPDQRQAMRKLMRQPSEKTLLSYLDRPGHSLSLDINRVVQHVQKADQAAVEKILTKPQRELLKKRQHAYSNNQGRKIHLHHAIQQARPGGVIIQVTDQQTTPKDNTAKPPPPPPGEGSAHAQRAINTYVLAQVKDTKASSSARYSSLLNALDLVVKLTPAQRQTLEFAAKGATERERQRQIQQYDSYVRRTIAGVGPSNIIGRLNNQGRVNISSTHTTEATRLWHTTIENTLTPSQLDAVKEQQQKKQKFLFNTLASFAIHTLDSHVRLRGQQASTLQDAITKQLPLYAPDIEQNFQSWSWENPWYFNSHYVVVIINTIPEEQFKKTLTKEQFSTWEKQLAPRTSSYWNSIQAAHKKRLEKEKQGRDKK